MTPVIQASHHCPARHPDALGARDLVHAPRAERPQTPDQGTAGGRDVVCGAAFFF